MKKLVLDLDALRVDSFATEEARERRGTVLAHDDTMETENCTFEDTCLVTTCVKTLKCPLTVKCAATEDGPE